MVYLYPHPYPVLPPSDDEAELEQDAAESSSQAQERQASPNAENGKPEDETGNAEKSRKRKRTRVTTAGTIALILPPVDEDLVARQWGDDLPDAGRLGRSWWDGVEVDVGDPVGKDGERNGGDNLDGDAVDVAAEKEEEVKDDAGAVKADDDIEDGEIPESPPPTSNPPMIRPPPSPSPNQTLTKPPTDANGIPILTKKHFHPKVIALAKKIAAQRGVKLVVDPDAARLLDTTSVEIDAGKAEEVKTEPTNMQKPADGRGTERNDSGIFIPEQSRTPFAREDSEISYLDSPSTPQSQTHQLSSTASLPPPPSSTNSTNHPVTPLGQGRRGRARGRGTGRWAGHWQAKAAAAAAREARAAQLAARGIAASPAPGVAGVGGGQEREVQEEGPEAEKRRRREVGVALGSSSWW